jgi:hypothetical protein
MVMKLAELKEELEARDEGNSGTKTWLRRRLHGCDRASCVDIRSPMEMSLIEPMGVYSLYYGSGSACVCCAAGLHIATYVAPVARRDLRIAGLSNLHLGSLNMSPVQCLPL